MESRRLVEVVRSNREGLTIPGQVAQIEAGGRHLGHCRCDAWIQGRGGPSGRVRDGGGIGRTRGPEGRKEALVVEEDS